MTGPSRSTSGARRPRRVSHPRRTLSYTRGFLSCIAPYEREKAWWVLGGILLLASTAAAIYVLLPWFLTRHRRLEPLSPHDPDQAPLLALLHALCREAGLPRPPEFWVSGMDDRKVDAFTFGRSGRYRVALAQGTVASFGLAPQRARAVVLHELAHLRNKDVDVTYLTVALALAFVPTGLLPLAVALIGTPAHSVLSVTWRSLVLVALVRVTCVSVLRMREYGADVRAAVWGAGPGLLDVLGTARGRPVPWWRRGPLAVHPSAAARAAEIVRPQELFRLRFTECFAAGLAVSVAASGLLTLLWLVLNRLDALDARWTVVLLCVPAALAVIGLGVWRAALFGGGTRVVLLAGAGPRSRAGRRRAARTPERHRPDGPTPRSGTGGSGVVPRAVRAHGGAVGVALPVGGALARHRGAPTEKGVASRAARRRASVRGAPERMDAAVRHAATHWAPSTTPPGSCTPSPTPPHRWVPTGCGPSSNTR